MNTINEYELITNFKPAQTLLEAWDIFDPAHTMDPELDYYIKRLDTELQKLFFQLKRSDHSMHSFLCGHQGSGKTTELFRFLRDKDIRDKYLPVYMTAKTFGKETVHLTHDALLLEIGLELVKQCKESGISKNYEKKLEDWGKDVVRTYLKNEAALAEVEAKGGVWLAFFKAQLSSRRDWKHEEKEILEPKVKDLVGILNMMAQDLQNKTNKRLLVMVDDLEKGETEAHRDMHSRLFLENYDILVQPRFSIIYTLPVYFRGIHDNRIPKNQMFAFSAVRLYEKEHKSQDKPPLNTEGMGYNLMKSFVRKRLKEGFEIFEDGVLDELLLIGGGLFRETARVIREAVYLAIADSSDKISIHHAETIFHKIKKEYQPIIRGSVVDILQRVLGSAEGWVEGVEPLLQSRAVVEYENCDLWLDLRYVLKYYVRNLKKLI